MGAEGAPHRVGPATWLVIGTTLLAAAVVAGVVIGVLVWQGRDDEATTATSVAPETAPTAPVTEPDEGDDDMLFRRETAAGIEVRVQIFDFGGEMGGPAIDVLAGAGGDDATTVAGSGPATTAAPVDPTDIDGNGVVDICEPTADLQAWAIDDTTIAQGSSPWTNGAIGGIYPQLLWPGMQATMMGVVAQVDADVTSVRLTGPDGATDEMAPIGGAIGLAVPIAAGGQVGDDIVMGNVDWTRQFQVTATRADGSALRADPRTMEMGHPAWGGPGPCTDAGFEEMPIEPDIELPAPGAEQPADPAAAQATIEENFGRLYGGDLDAAARLELVDDPFGLADVLEQIGSGGFSDEAAAASVEVLELVFTSATEATFEYQLTSPGIDWPVQLGRARLVDGAWKITRLTYCQDLQKAGVQCPA